MAKKRSVSTSRADREDDRRRRNAPRRAFSSFDRNEMERHNNMYAGFYPVGFTEKFVDKSLGTLARGTGRVLNRNFAREQNAKKKFNKNEARVSKVGRDSSPLWAVNPRRKAPDLSKVAAGKPTQPQKRLTVARAEKNRQTSAARSAGRKKASATKRRER